MLPTYDDLKIEMSTPDFDLGTCVNAKLGVPQQRYYIVIKKKNYTEKLANNESHDIKDNIVSSISFNAYQSIKHAFIFAMDSINNLKKELNVAKERAESFKFVIDTLKRNNCID